MEWMLVSLNLMSGEGGIQYLLSVCSKHAFVQSVPSPAKVSFCTGKPIFLVKGQTAELPPLFKTLFTLVRLQSGVIYMFHVQKCIYPHSCLSSTSYPNNSGRFTGHNLLAAHFFSTAWKSSACCHVQGTAER